MYMYCKIAFKCIIFHLACDMITNSNIVIMTYDKYAMIYIENI